MLQLTSQAAPEHRSECVKKLKEMESFLLPVKTIVSAKNFPRLPRTLTYFFLEIVFFVRTSYLFVLGTYDIFRIYTYLRDLEGDGIERRSSRKRKGK